MSSKEFIIWLKGFTEGLDREFNITTSQWTLLKERLAEVDDNTIPMGGVIYNPNTTTTWDPSKSNWHYTNTTQKLDND